MPQSLRAVGFLTLGLLGAACAPEPYALQSKAGQLLGGQDCDPIGGQCGFPFPSDVWLVKTSAGPRVRFGATTLPVAAGENTDPKLFNDNDGFSPGQAPMLYMPGAWPFKKDTTETYLPSPITIDASLTNDSPTILLDAATGERIPHWAEFDVSVNDHNGENTFLIRPARRLKDSTRYIVAIRKVMDKDGNVLPPTDAFKALRDEATSTDPTVNPRRLLYKDIFERLKKAGIDRGSLQVAWDYTTASKENNTAGMIALRDRALAIVGADGPEYTIPTTRINVAPPEAEMVGRDADWIEGITLNPNENIAMRIEGMMRVPNFLTQPNPPQNPDNYSPCRLVKDDKGLPMVNPVMPWAEYPFEVQIPKSVVAAKVPAVVVQNGHGLLGSRHEGHNGYMARMANEKHYIALSVNLLGFDHYAYPSAIQAVQGNVDKFLDMVDPQTQGMVNQLLAMRMMWRMAKDPRFFFNDAGEPDPNGHSLIDATNDLTHPTHFYRGDSQGGIMGATYMAITTDVVRGVLGEPGMPYNLLLNRSLDFDAYFFMLKATYLEHDQRDIQLILALMQMMWDRTEPNGYAPYINKDMLPNTPKHEVLLNVAMGDYQVTPFGAHLIARAVGAKNLAPVNREIFEVPSAAGPLEGSVMTEFNYHLEPMVTMPLTNRSNSGPENCDPHDWVREQSAVFNQSDTFFRTGKVYNYCTGESLLRDTGNICSFDEKVGKTSAEIIEPPAAPTACTPG